jgi:hypothetical protein
MLKDTKEKKHNTEDVGSRRVEEDYVRVNDGLGVFFVDGCQKTLHR